MINRSCFGDASISGMTEYKFYFNEIDAETSAISDDLLLGMQAYSNPAILVYFIVIAFSAWGGFEIFDESNSTTITESGKYYNYHEIALSHKLYDAGDDEWMNMSLTSSSELNYGKTSNVLTEATSTATMTMTTYNSTSLAYETTTLSIDSKMSTVYLSSLVDELEAGSKGLLDMIPGFTPISLGIAVVIGVFMIIRKRK